MGREELDRRLGGGHAREVGVRKPMKTRVSTTAPDAMMLALVATVSSFMDKSLPSKG
tara:strand:- start:2202 stop:2372 length:171 start_codon:yes stop_codon:yes gene_type:complete